MPELLEKTERLLLTQERIDAFLAEQEKRYPAREEITSEGPTTAIYIPDGSEIVVTWSSEHPVELLCRRDGRFKWESLGEHDPGTYMLRFPRDPEMRQYGLLSQGPVKASWR